MNYNVLTDRSISFLSELLATHSPSGYEMPAAKVYSKYISKFCDSVYSDIMCNTVGVLSPDLEYKVLLAAHCDEIGFQIVYIDDNGFLYFRAIGGIDKHTVLGKEVSINTPKGYITGIIGKKPPHIQDETERNKVIDIADMWIDIGATNGDEAKSLVSIGSTVTLKSNFIKLGENRIASKGIDDKIGVFVVAETLRILSLKEVNVGVYGIATSQEELGTRGIKTISNFISPNIGYVIDVGISTDVPNIKKTQYGEFRLGGGPGICHSADNNTKIVESLQNTAKLLKIPFQDITWLRASGGTDTAELQLSKNGVATGLISIPSRYMHSSVECCDLRDVDNAIYLLAETIVKLKGSESYLPYDVKND